MNSEFFPNAQSRFASVVFDRVCLGTNVPSAEHHTVSLSASKSMFIALEGCSVLSAQKSYKGPRLVVAGRNGREKSFPDEESLILPPRQTDDSFSKTNTVLVARPMKNGVVKRRGHTTILQRYNDDSSTAI